MDPNIWAQSHLQIWISLDPCYAWLKTCYKQTIESISEFEFEVGSENCQLETDLKILVYK